MVKQREKVWLLYLMVPMVTHVKRVHSWEKGNGHSSNVVQQGDVVVM